MKIETFKFDILTRLFSAGANADKEGGAEIRATEVRSQLRWWFRILGGFNNDNRSVKEQEKIYFGGVGDNPSKSKLGVRVKVSAALRQEFKDADALGASLNSPLGYLLFPLRSNPNKGVYASRAHFVPNEFNKHAFEVSLFMEGTEREWVNIKALITILGSLGALGFRSRRCMGAIANHESPPMSLAEALAYFRSPTNIIVKSLGLGSDTVDGSVKELSNWLKDWRSYGSSRFGLNEGGRGFKFAKKDHDAGVVDRGDDVYRAAIGLPIIQQYSSGERVKNEWEANDAERFASPVILRPHRKEDGRFIPLVIFADLYKWDDKRKVQLFRKNKETKRRDVYRTVRGSNELYEEMKKDERLKDFI